MLYKAGIQPIFYNNYNEVQPLKIVNHYFIHLLTYNITYQQYCNKELK